MLQVVKYAVPLDLFVKLDFSNLRKMKFFWKSFNPLSASVESTPHGSDVTL